MGKAGIVTRRPSKPARTLLTRYGFNVYSRKIWATDCNKKVEVVGGLKSGMKMFSDRGMQ